MTVEITRVADSRTMTKPARPPVAPQRPVTLEAHGDERIDPWYWLRDRSDPEAIAYLEAENEFTKAALAHTTALQSELFAEIKGRVQETDVTPPITRGEWDYFSRTFEGQQYAVHLRRPAGAPEGDDEITLLDENELAGDSDYFQLGGAVLSPDTSLLAFSTDYDGGERYTLRVRDLATLTDLADTIEDVYYGFDFATDNRTLFYVRPDDAVRPYQIWRHVIGTSTADDVLVYEEEDERFFVSVALTRSEDYLVITSESKLTSETRLVPAADATAAPSVLEPRTQGVEYHVEHHRSADGSDRFFVLTNADGAENFKLMVAPTSSPGRAHWAELLPHDPDVKLDDVDAFVGHLVISQRADGLEQLRVLPLGGSDGGEPVGDRIVAMPEPVYSVWVAENPNFVTDTLRYGYTSLVLPTSAYDESLTEGGSTLVKRTPVLGGYDPERYTSARIWATAGDGTQVPISVVHRTDVALDGTAPAVLYGYGSYEHSIDPAFSSVRLSLLDRGFVFAIAHVRGGGELGRRWYEDGKLAHKGNTFTDFVSCAERLIELRYTSADRLAARGGSAGGLLMGAAMNLRPDLFRAIVAEVPFVDVVTTMSDPSLPLTVTEWEEWGNPVDDTEAYRVMKSYSPYDNVARTAYPAVLATGGLNDPRVSYWEPAKWVAKLRATKTDNRLLVLKTEMGAGHGGPSGRYDAWRDEAMVLAFLIDQLTSGGAPQ
jgi:oligopeptidase B